MESIHIICNQCNEYIINEHQNTISIEYDNDFVEQIIVSNYTTYIKICKHNELRLIKISLKLKDVVQYNLSLNYYCFHNDNYLKLYGVLSVEKINENFKLKFGDNSYDYSSNSKISIEELPNKIKKGTIIIRCHASSVSDVEKLLFENNTGFIIKNVNKESCNMFIIDVPTLTKSATKK